MNRVPTIDLSFALELHALHVGKCGPIDHRSMAGEARAVAWTIKGMLVAVPL